MQTSNNIESKKKSTHKNCAIIYICKLNTINIIDLYSLLLQRNIIIKLQKYSYITIIDKSEQFYQFLIKKSIEIALQLYYIAKKNNRFFLIEIKRLILYIQNKVNKFLKFY